MAGYTFLPDLTADHNTFAFINDEAWLDLLVEQIEMEPVFEDNSTSKDCPNPQGNSNSMDDSAQIGIFGFGGAISLTLRAIFLF